MVHFQTFLRISCIVSILLTGCSSQTQTPQNPPTQTASPGLTSSPLPTITPSPLSTNTPLPSNTPTIAAKFTSSIDVAAYAAENDGQWFGGEFVNNFPNVALQPSTTFIIPGSTVPNRRNGQISLTLASRYVFLQTDFGSKAVQEDFFITMGNTGTIRGLFIRSALMSFVDYKDNRVLDWDGRSQNIPLYINKIISQANRFSYPVYLELNYSDYIAGSYGTGVESLLPDDNITRTIEFLQMLEAEGLHVDGLTFGDEIGDPNNFDNKKPTMMSENIADRFIRYALAIKNAFPEIKMYAFDSDISASSGEIALYYDLFTRIHEAEEESGLILLDGFIYRESYVYIDENGKLLDSQKILDDTESLYRPTKVYRFDSMGYSYKNPDADYLHTLIKKTDEIFGRSLEIGLTEYLPAGPTQIDESDTSRYIDIDFILHYADVMGIYATLGLDFVSTWLGANSVDQAKCYFTKDWEQGVNFPVIQNISRYFKGELVEVKQDPISPGSRLKVYASKDGDFTFIMLLNKVVRSPQVVRLIIPGEIDLTLNLPARSYTSILINGNMIEISGIGK